MAKKSTSKKATPTSPSPAKKGSAQAAAHTPSSSKILTIVAVVVVVAALAVIVVGRMTPNTQAATSTTASTPSASASATQASADDSARVVDLEVADGNATINVSDLSSQALFLDYDANGTTVELIALLSSTGEPRVALNTCQVCNGSPYAYFVQSGSYLICQNCKNRFTADDVGVESGGCNPVPITDATYTVENGVITLPTSYLDSLASMFSNWKQF